MKISDIWSWNNYCYSWIVTFESLHEIPVYSQKFLSYTLAFANSIPPHTPNYFDLVSLGWKNLPLPRCPVKNKKSSGLYRLQCGDDAFTQSAMHKTNNTEQQQLHRYCACLLGFYSTLNQSYLLAMLKEYLSNIWRVGACYSSQKRKVTGFDPENHS